LMLTLNSTPSDQPLLHHGMQSNVRSDCTKARMGSHL